MENKQESISSTSGLDRTFKILGVVVLGGIILYVGKALFIPLSFALFISFLLLPFCNQLERKGFGRVLAILTGIVLLTAVCILLFYLLFIQFKNFAQDWAVLSTTLKDLLVSIKSFLISELGMKQQQVDKWYEDVVSSIAGNTVNMIESTLLSAFVYVVMLFLIPIYAFLILYYRHLLVEVVYSLFSTEYRKRIQEVLGLSIDTYYSFIKGMAVVYFIVGVLNSLGLLALGIPHPFLFGFLTAVMTFIPYVGIIIASVLPITYAWITYNSIFYPLAVIAVFTLVQYLEANIIFPWAVSQKLQLNTLVTLAIIVIGGILWGAAGMILFIPFAAILKLIADRMEGWESLARFLGKS